MNESKETFRQFGVSCSNFTILLKLLEETFDPMALLVEFFIIRPWFLLIGLRWDTIGTSRLFYLLP
jgi:hypothetical protein